MKNRRMHFMKKWRRTEFTVFNKILKILISAIFILGFSLNANCSEQYNSNVLKTGISLSERVPTAFFGTWRVKSTLIETDSPANFKKENVDIWNLSKQGSVINLENPFSGASASITLDYAGTDAIRFSRKGNYDSRILTDTVELHLDKDKFTGINTLTLETLSDIDNSVIKRVSAKYSLKGEKIAGTNII